MKRLQKILVSVDLFGFIHGYCKENHPPGCVEYINKDSLLRWIKKKIKEECLDPQYVKAMKDAMDKINKM